MHLEDLKEAFHFKKFKLLYGTAKNFLINLMQQTYQMSVLLWLETEYETKHPSGYQYQLLSDCNCGGTQSQLNRVINFTLISS